LDESAAGIEKRGVVEKHRRNEIRPGRVETGAFASSDAAGQGKASVWAQGSPGRKWIALALLVALSGLAVKTIDPGKIRTVVLLLLGVFALRIVFTASASR
jgi:hypothetical protein